MEALHTQVANSTAVWWCRGDQPEPSEQGVSERPQSQSKHDGCIRVVVSGPRLEDPVANIVALHDMESEGASHARARRLHAQVAEPSAIGGKTNGASSRGSSMAKSVEIHMLLAQAARRANTFPCDCGPHSRKRSHHRAGWGRACAIDAGEPRPEPLLWCRGGCAAQPAQRAARGGRPLVRSRRARRAARKMPRQLIWPRQTSTRGRRRLHKIALSSGGSAQRCCYHRLRPSKWHNLLHPDSRPTCRRDLTDCLCLSKGSDL